MRNHKLALIPSAKIAPVELQNEFGQITTAMIPIDSKPAIDYISTYLNQQGYSILVAYHEEASDLLSFCENWSLSQITTTDVGDTQSLGQSILNALNSSDLANVSQLVINFADTIISDNIPESNTIFYAELDDTFRWTTFDTSNQNELVSITEKYDPHQQASAISKVFVGMFSFLKPLKFKELLEQCVANKEVTNIDPFYAALKDYFNGLEPDDRHLQQVNQWFDFGHIDTYYRTKKQINIGAREFNFVDLDNKRGIIIKSSNHDSKFRNEINWYLKLPNELKYMTPRVLEYRVQEKDSYLKLEYYGYPALNDAYLFGNYDLGTWNQIFTAIEFLIEEMGRFTKSSNTSGSIRNSLIEIYIDKTRDRVHQYLMDPKFSNFRGEKLSINHKDCLGLDSFYACFGQVVENLGLLEESEFSIIHGDLCLSNLLYDRRNQIIRVIDPRGSFGHFDIYGDPRYDAAKLSHSVSGDYDFLVNGLFDLEWENSKSLLVSPRLKKKHLDIKNLFLNKFQSKNKYIQVKLIESLLFLSMVPLHGDRPNSQQAFIARGLSLFSEVCEYIEQGA